MNYLQDANKTAKMKELLRNLWYYNVTRGGPNIINLRTRSELGSFAEKV